MSFGYKMASGAAALLLSASALAQTAEIIYDNATVITVNPAFELAQAVAIADGRILAVGTSAEVRALAAPSTQIVDLGGKTLLPGFYDNHIHLGGPLQPWKFGGLIEEVPEWIRGADTIPEVLAAIQKQAAILPKGSWIIGELPREEWPNNSLPTRWDFDKVSPDHPVALARGPHTLLVNSNALKLAGVTRETKPAGGEIVHDANGEPNGKILESARRVITDVMPEELRGGSGTAEEQLAGWHRELVQLAEAGVTSVNVAGVRPNGLPLVQTLYDRWGEQLPRMTVQLRVSPGYDTHDDPAEGVKQSIAEIEAIGDPSKMFHHPKLKMGAVKMSIDGGLSAPIFWSLKPYENRPGFYGEQRIPDEAFAAVAKRAHELGWQIGTHVMGDAAVVMVTNEMAKILQASPKADHRHYLHHVAVLPPVDTVRKIAANNLLVASQPGFLLSLGSYADEALEPEREATQQPAGSLLREGVRVSFGSDAGPYGPVAGLFAAVTRTNWKGEVRGPGEAVPIKNAIIMHTMESAYLTFDEKTRGSIEPGKVADFVVLDRNPLQIAANDLQNIKIERTIIAGKEVYARSPAGNSSR